MGWSLWPNRRTLWRSHDGPHVLLSPSLANLTNKMNKHYFLSLALILLFICAPPVSQAQQPLEVNGATQYKLSSDETLVEALELRAGEKHDLVVPSDKEIMVGFNTNLSDEYVSKNIQDSIKKHTHLLPTITQKETGMSCGSTIGCAQAFTPKDGKISLIVSNPLDCSVKLLIYTQVIK